ncbi:hypothetical protein DVH24_018593 [Malus domestica]|uniref:Secreted protein n=1 Tax=Malus domestica TaxID=3750 RepID=A0A498HI99_MALDO|nr:hypothetical protein DVH24_018593 [Malus domestica]
MKFRGKASIVKYISLLTAIFSLQLTKVVTEAVNDLIEDIKTCHEQIADLMVELIHQNEMVLTLIRPVENREEVPMCCKEETTIPGLCCCGCSKVCT